MCCREWGTRHTAAAKRREAVSRKQACKGHWRIMKIVGPDMSGTGREKETVGVAITEVTTKTNCSPSGPGRERERFDRSKIRCWSMIMMPVNWARMGTFKLFESQVQM